MFIGEKTSFTLSFTVRPHDGYSLLTMDQKTYKLVDYFAVDVTTESAIKVDIEKWISRTIPQNLTDCF